MERPTYDEAITRQNHIYATEILERCNDKPKNADTCLSAITGAFILGAGGYEGSFDAACVLESGGLAILLEHLGVADIDVDPAGVVSDETFEEVIRAAVDFGASYDDIEAEIPLHATSDADITGVIFGPLAGRFNLLDPKPWLPE